MKKILIIRFSSFGDIVQASAALSPLKLQYPDAKIDWLTRSEFSTLVQSFSLVDKVIGFDRKVGMSGLIELGKKLSIDQYDLVYDAHSNLRSFVLKQVFSFHSPQTKICTREKNRLKRILLFYLKVNTFSWPYKGMESYLKPLIDSKLIENQKVSCGKWNLKKCENISAIPSWFKEAIVLAPSAAWEMKRWPTSHWDKLIEIQPLQKFLVLGGPSDHFCEEFEKKYPERVVNLAGKLSLLESSSLVNEAKLTISADTGIIHVADSLGKKAISLIGPTAFGFCSGDHVRTLQIPLECRPCTKDGRGKCVQSIYQKCMVDITPELVLSEINDLLSHFP